MEATLPCTDTMDTSTLLPNPIENNAALSTGGGGNPTVSPNTNMMATSTNAIGTSTNMATSTDMASDNLSILINFAAFQEP